MEVKCPDLKSIQRGSRYAYRAKIGGERRCIMVFCKTTPYQKDIGKGRHAWYVDVFGWGFKGCVNVKKLMVRAPKQDNLLSKEDL